MNTVQKDITGKTGLPLIRLSLIIPFVQALEQVSLDVEGILNTFDLNREALDNPDIFVPALTVYKIIEAMADAAEDPYLAVHVGESLNLTEWPVFTDSVKHASSFGDFFFRFAAESVNQASSVQMRLDTNGEHATFRAYRVFDPPMVPAQADAFYVGLFTTIFRLCAGKKWNSREVLVKLSDPGAVPLGYHNLTVLKGDRRGPSIRFPQRWLLYAIDIGHIENDTDKDISYQSPPRTLIDAIRQALRPHIHRHDLSAEQAAELCGYDNRALGRKLKATGTSLSNEIAQLREERVIELLKQSELSIADIANSVGFSDPSIFSRAFKRWTGLSPRAYRNQYR